MLNCVKYRYSYQLIAIFAEIKTQEKSYYPNK